MRRPVQHRNFKLKNNVGLSTILSGESTFDKCVHETKNGNFAVLTSGVLPPNPSELLASEKMRELLEYVQHKYDYVIVDGTPLLPVTDVMTLQTRSQASSCGKIWQNYISGDRGVYEEA